MHTFKFDNIEDLQRNRKLECEGVEVGCPGDIVLLVRAASDANPLWKAQSERISAQIRRFATARASNEEVPPSSCWSSASSRCCGSIIWLS